MSRFDATLCTTAIIMVALVLGFAIIRPASRPESQAAVLPASPARPSSGGLPLAPTGAPDTVSGPGGGEISASGLISGSAQQSAAGTLAGAPSPKPTRTTVPRRPASSRTTSPGTAGPAEAVRVTAAASRRSIHGLSTWYCCTRGYSASSYVAAAGPALRIGHWRGRWVWVTAGAHRIRVRLVDYCVCRSFVVIDLHPAPFRALAPLSRGVVSVKVTW